MLSEKIKKNAADFIGMPQDVMLGLSEIVLEGNRRLIFSSCRNIGGYSEKEIKLYGADVTAVIKGGNLIIDSIENGEIIVSGRIISLEFL